MKIIIFYFSIVTALYSCNTNETVKNINPSNDNYVVILDLSDRLIHNNQQVDFDTSAISAVFQKFEKSIQRNLVVKSIDKFSIRIIPQANSKIDINNLQNSLSIDLSKFNASQKLKALNDFKFNFSKSLSKLYQQAFLGSKDSDYPGVDIWQYFNEQINTDLDSRYNNKILVLTDGYFDFEDHAHGIRKGNTATITAPLLTKMRQDNWQLISDSLKIGLVPVLFNVKSKWVIAGIQPKQQSQDLLEAKKLSYLWKKWLTQSGQTNIDEPIINTNSYKVKSLILAYF
jgi:hypothetical protein